MKSIESLREKFVHIVKAAAFNSFPHPSFELRLMDFDGH
jgi:hypothetical protein